MAYARLSDDVSVESPYEETALSQLPPHTLAQYFSYKNLFGASLVLWIVTLGSLAWFMGQRHSIYGNHVVNLLPFLPVPSRIVTFDVDPKFHYTAKDAGEPAWAALMPIDDGIISVADPSRYQLPSSYKNRNVSGSEVYSMSMFHQLHCLDSVRVRLGILEGFMNETATGIRKRASFSPESHVNHCFDYLRQAIMCAGDLSLEHSVVPDEFGFNGWGTSHQCADWDAVWDIAVQHRYDQSIEELAKLR